MNEKTMQFSLVVLNAARLLSRIGPVIENMASTGTLGADRDK